MAFRGPFGTCTECQRSLRDMCRGGLSRIPLRGLYGTCAEYLRGGFWKRINSVSHPEIIKFLVKFSKPSNWFEPSTLVKLADYPRSGAFRRLARPPEKSARYIVKERLPLGHTTKRIRGYRASFTIPTIRLYKPYNYSPL